MTDLPPMAAAEQKPNRRKLRMISQIILTKAGYFYKLGTMTREFSPRSVECRLCGTAVMGNDEERVRINVITPFGHQFWMKRANIYFHTQCMLSWLTDGKIKEILTGEILTGECEICRRWGHGTVCEDGLRRCRHCLPGYRLLINQAKEAVVTLDAIASSD